jgi:glyoxylase-like metal-dependent hydrolase (beta-lactamase superfamily II)
MLTRIAENVYGFVWNDYRQNNCNTYLIDGDRRILIDPGHARLFGHVEQGLARLGLSRDDVDLVLATHGHPDHLEGVGLFEGKSLFAISQTEYRFVTSQGRYAAQLPRPDFFLASGSLKFGELRFEVIETPGHSPGGICLYWPFMKALFPGDLVFLQGVGRADLPGGDPEELKESIRRIKNLDVAYLLSGHGNVVSGKDKVRSNFRFIEEHYFRSA